MPIAKHAPPTIPDNVAPPHRTLLLRTEYNANGSHANMPPLAIETIICSSKNETEAFSQPPSKRSTTICNRNRVGTNARNCMIKNEPDSVVAFIPSGSSTGLLPLGWYGLSSFMFVQKRLARQSAISNEWANHLLAEQNIQPMRLDATPSFGPLRIP